MGSGTPWGRTAASPAPPCEGEQRCPNPRREAQPRPAPPRSYLGKPQRHSRSGRSLEQEQQAEYGAQRHLRGFKSLCRRRRFVALCLASGCRRPVAVATRNGRLRGAGPLPRRRGGTRWRAPRSRFAALPPLPPRREAALRPGRRKGPAAPGSPGFGGACPRPAPALPAGGGPRARCWRRLFPANFALYIPAVEVETHSEPCSKTRLFIFELVIYRTVARRQMYQT